MVVAIIAIVSAVAVPRLSAALARQGLDAAVRRIGTDMAYARRRAQTTSAGVTVTFDAAASTYALVGIADMDDPAAAYTVDLSTSPYGVQLLTADFGGDATIVFDGFGVPDTGGLIVIGIGSEVRTLSVDAATGMTTLVDVAPAPGGGFDVLPTAPSPPTVP